MPVLLGTTAVMMEAHQITHMAGATPFLCGLLDAAKAVDTRLPHLKLFICGGASVPPALNRTGDQGAWIDGCPTVTARIKDLIIRNGENIAPKEIEDLLVSHRAPNGKHASGQFINEYRAELDCLRSVSGGRRPIEEKAIRKDRTLARHHRSVDRACRCQYLLCLTLSVLNGPMPKLLFITSGVPGPGLMSGPVHLRVLRFLSRHFDAICASYSDDDTSHIARFYRLPHRAWWWPPGRLGLHPLLRARKIISDLGIGLAGASSILCASDALAELMKAFNPNSRVLFPSPGDPLNQVPAFSNGPIALAGGFNARYLMLAKKLGIPVVAIGESPGGDHVDVTFIPRFAENDEAVRFVSAKCSSVAVIVPNGHADYASHSFPSKLLDFARAGLPIIIIAPLDSPVGRWAKLRDWPLFIADEDDNAAFDQATKVLSHEAGWLNAQRHVLAVASGEFSADAIHEVLLGEVNTMALKAAIP